jgi:hypothetical protein
MEMQSMWQSASGQFNSTRVVVVICQGHMARDRDQIRSSI